MQDLFQDLPLFDFNDSLFRNIKSIRHSQDLFDDLSDNSNEWQHAIQAEINSKPLFFQEPPIIHRPFDEARLIEAINFPFHPENWAASRYSNGSFGVWYGAVEFETSIHETAHHWREFLKKSGLDRYKKPIVSERKVFKVQCQGLLIDFRKKVEDFPALVDTTNYSFTQQVGHHLQAQGHPGLLSVSSRTPGSISALFTPKILKDPKDYCYLNYSFNPATQKIKVERSPGKLLEII